MKITTILSALALTTAVSNAGVIMLYDADPDNNSGTLAPDPTSQGWGSLRANGGTPSAGWGTAGTTTSGAQAWILNDAGATGTGAQNQGGSLYYDLSATLVRSMHANGFTLTVNYEQLSSGSFVGIGLNNDGVNSQFGQTVDRRYGATPSSGLQSQTWSWDGTTFTTAAAGANNTDTKWIGTEEGGMRVFFGDNTVNNSAMNLAITSVTLETAAIPEPTSTALLGLGGFSLLLRRRR